jgi:hypothetical protein
MFRRLAALFVRVLAHRATFAFASGAIATACFANWWQQIAALLGTSQPVRLGLVAAAALGFIAAITTRAWRPLEAFSPAAPSAIACFALAAWGMAAVWLVQLAESILSHPGVIALDSGAWNAVAFFGIGVMLLGIPACCVGRLAIEQQRTVGVLAGPAWFLIGASGGIVVWS